MSAHRPGNPGSIEKTGGVMALAVVLCVAGGLPARAQTENPPPEPVQMPWSVPVEETEPVLVLEQEEASVPLIHPSRELPPEEVSAEEERFEREADRLAEEVQRRKARGRAILDAQEKFEDGLATPPDIPGLDTP